MQNPTTGGVWTRDPATGDLKPHHADDAAPEAVKVGRQSPADLDTSIGLTAAAIGADPTTRKKGR